MSNQDRSLAAASRDDPDRPIKRRRVSKAPAHAEDASKPAKRPRGRPRKNATVTIAPDSSDSDAPVGPRRRKSAIISAKSRSASISSINVTVPKSVANKGRKAASTASISYGSATDSEDAFAPAAEINAAPRSARPADSDGEERAIKIKKPKHSIHQPAAQPMLADMYLSQAPPPQSSDPSALRGPIWIQRKPDQVAPVATKPTVSPTLIKSAMPPPARTSKLATPSALAAGYTLESRVFAGSKHADKFAIYEDVENQPVQAAPPPERENFVVPAIRPNASNKTLKDFTAVKSREAVRRGSTDRHPTADLAAQIDSDATATSHRCRNKVDPRHSLTARGDGKGNDERDPRTQIMPCGATESLVLHNIVKDVAASPDGVVHPSYERITTTMDDRMTLRDSEMGLVFSDADLSNTPSALILANNVAPLRTGFSNPSHTKENTIDLSDIPSDAFVSDPEIESPNAPISRQLLPQKGPGLTIAPSGMRQTTLFGSVAGPPALGQERGKTKAISWPSADREEKPTHHKLNQRAIQTWVYPVNLGTIRDYQYSIVHTGLFHNLLVALPTGLGKTFIAATIMLNWYRWTEDAQIVFVAPTKPLVAQQIDACFHTVGIPRSDTAMLTGSVSPAVREQAWKERRVFFMTPQTMGNDLRKGICDPKRLVLLVVDEAHRATGNHSYVDIVRFLRRFNTSFRVLALTATPGAKVETVQQVINGLDISRVEIRTEQSLDIRSYVHERDTESFLFDYSEEQDRVMELSSKAIKPVLDRLNGLNATWMKDPMKLSAFGLTQSQRQWAASEAGKSASWPVKAMVSGTFKVLASLAHAITMLRFHGIGPFFRRIKVFKSDVDNGILKMQTARQIKENENFVKMFNMVQTWTNHADFIGHPKLEYLRQVVHSHFYDAEHLARRDAKAATTRVMVFAQYRDSAEEITRVLKRNDPLIRPHVFVGQATSQESAGMDQKTQLDVIAKFKDGTYNTLVATSIGEEGLDIGEVDLILCYDANASPIRMLQRMGRTGRKRQGKIVLLLMKDKEQRDFASAKDNYEKMQDMITSGKHFEYHDERCSRILPKDVKPTVDKRVVEIPIENSQSDLPVPTKASRGKKKTAKKFHMPDGVVTGFVKASRVSGEGVADLSSGGDGDIATKGCRRTLPKQTAKASRVSVPVPEPEAVPLPFLEDVLLNKMQERELERKYQYIADTNGAVVLAPMPEKNLCGFRRLSSAKVVRHGRWAKSVADTLERMRTTDGVTLARFEESLHHSDLEDVDADRLLVSNVPQEQDSVPGSSDDDEDLPSQPVPRERTANQPRQRTKATQTARVQADEKLELPSDYDEDLPSQPTKRTGTTTSRNTTAASHPKQRVNTNARTRTTSNRNVAASIREAVETNTWPARSKSNSGPNPHKARSSRARQLERASSGAMEGVASSSPPPTPADMRLPSQGIALGSDDTSGEDATQRARDHLDDSDLASFIAGSDEEIEFASSSAPLVSVGTQQRRGRLLKRTRPDPNQSRAGAGRAERLRLFSSQSDRAAFDNDDDDDDDHPSSSLAESDGDESIGFDPARDERLSAAPLITIAARAGKRKRVVHSDSDE